MCSKQGPTLRELCLHIRLRMSESRQNPNQCISQFGSLLDPLMERHVDI